MGASTPTRRKPLWEPREPEATNVARFMSYINEKHCLRLESYDDLHSWSVHPSTLQNFWTDAYEWLRLAPEGSGIKGRPISIEDPARVDLFPPPKFFPEESLNIAELLLRARNDDNIAIYFAREGASGTEDVTWGNLKERVRTLRSALLNSGVGPNDVVAAVITNSVNAVAISLAALSIGAIWSSSSCDLGTPGIVDRYRQIHPKVIFADDGYMYAGKRIDLSGRIREWSHLLLKEKGPNWRRLVVVPHSGLTSDVACASIPEAESLQDFTRNDLGDALTFDMMPFNHPSFILFSSGTTGPPKCIVHTMGGVALKVQVDMAQQHDVRRSDVVFQYTTTSWVMWVLNLLNLSCAASMLLYDGSPFHPRPTILLELAEKTRVTVFGTSPKYLAALKSSGIVPRQQFNLERLRVVTSTGSVLSAEQFEWFYKEGFPSSVHLASMSGGTDISGCFVGGTPLLPVYAGEIQCKALGMAVEFYDSSSKEGKSIEQSGSPGELVCVRPFPSQPLAFIGQGGEAKYRSSYFQRFGTRVWCQGDYAQKLPDTGGIVILGRSDGVLNPSGVRFGSAEIYAITDTIPEIADSLCVGQKREIDDDERVLLFVKLQPGKQLTPSLDTQIRTAIRTAYSPRHVPRFIFEIRDIPYTVNGKKCEINVKNIVCCRKTAVSGTVANPEALALYERYQKLPPDGDNLAATSQAKL